MHNKVFFFFLVYKIYLQYYRPSFLFPALLLKSGGLAVLLVVRGFVKEKFNVKYFWNFPKLWLHYQVSSKNISSILFLPKTLMKASFLGPNIFFSYFEIMAQSNDHNFFQVEQNLN